MNLHTLLKAKKYNQAIQSIKQLQPTIDLEDFSFNKQSYSRNILTTKDNYWLAIIAWDKDSKTPIHGHPDQAFVYLLSGKLIINNYQTPELTLTEEITCLPSQYNIHHGQKGQLDNAVHRIYATKPSLSLHFYSDDPSLGQTF